MNRSLMYTKFKSNLFEFMILHMKRRFARYYTVPTTPVLTKHSKERRFLYFNHLSKEFLEQMIPQLKALI